MSALPVVTAIGGINAAGRSSCQQAFRRLVIDALDSQQRHHTLKHLAALTGLDQQQALLDATLVRRLEGNLFNASEVPANMAARLDTDASLTVRNMDLPDPLPAGWQVKPISRTHSEVRVAAGCQVFMPAPHRARVQAAGQLPTGFDPAALYPSRNHPRGLQMAIYGASDALGMLGIDWQQVRQAVAPEQVAVYASAAMSQLDDAGLGGMLKSPAYGKRITSKQCPLGLGEMPADFINAYVLGSVGRTGGMLGACASFLYNLSLGVHDIRSGRARVALVGTAEAPLVPEVMEGYRAMGALAEDDDLLKLDPGATQPDWRRACRPFAHNCGFTLAESAQFVVLMDDALALELGADIMASVPDVFVHADGTKKSISAPGIGNYITLGRAMALARQLVGEDTLRRHSFMSAHGTGTPQNRTTESHVLNELAAAFSIDAWPVCAVKAYLGHSLASASGDQMMAALGTFDSGLLPGISTISALAPDLHRSHLDFALQHKQLESPAVAFLNSKGFGGNNATALMLSPAQSLSLLRARHGNTVIDTWQNKHQQVLEQRKHYDSECLANRARPVYRFAENVLGGEDLAISADRISVPGWNDAVTLAGDQSFAPYLRR